MGSYNKRISDQSKIKFDYINRELIDSENSELDARVESLEENITGSKTATGNPLTVTDAAPVNAVNLSMDLEPIQAGSGTPSPDNIRPISGRSEVAIDRVGKNLYPITVGEDYWDNNSGATHSNNNGELVITVNNNNYSGVYSSDTNNILRKTCLVLSNFTISADVKASANMSVKLSSVEVQLTTSYQRLTFGTSTMISIYGTGTAGTIYVKNLQLELGTTATDFEPYLSKNYTIQLGQDVYGGQLDVTKGKMVVDSGYIASYNGETLPSTWISDRDVYASETSPTTGAQVVYELAEPFTIDLTPTQIKLLENSNTITTDNDGDVLSLEYQSNNAFGELLGEVNNIYDSIIEDIYDKIDSLDTRVTALEE